MKGAHRFIGRKARGKFGHRGQKIDRTDISLPDLTQTDDSEIQTSRRRHSSDDEMHDLFGDVGTNFVAREIGVNLTGYQLRDDDNDSDAGDAYIKQAKLKTRHADVHLPSEELLKVVASRPPVEIQSKHGKAKNDVRAGVEPVREAGHKVDGPNKRTVVIEPEEDDVLAPLEVIIESTRDNQWRMEDRSFWIWDSGSSFRRNCFKVVFDPVYEWFMLILNMGYVIVSIVHVKKEATPLQAMSDMVMMVLMGVECSMKLVALTAVTAKNAYFRHPMHWMDFIILAAMLYGSVSGYYGFGAFRVLRILIVLRVVSTFNFLDGILQAVSMAFARLLDVAFLLGLFFLLFGVSSVEFYESSLTRICFIAEGKGNATVYLPVVPNRYCKNGTEFWSTSPCLGESICRDTVGLYGGAVSFDTLYKSWKTLAQVISLSNWSDIMFACMQSELAILSGFWFVIAVSLGAILIPSLTTAIVVSVFAALRLERGSSAFLKRHSRKAPAIDARKNAEDLGQASEVAGIVDKIVFAANERCAGVRPEYDNTSTVSGPRSESVLTSGNNDRSFQDQETPLPPYNTPSGDRSRTPAGAQTAQAEPAEDKGETESHHSQASEDEAVASTARSRNRTVSESDKKEKASVTGTERRDTVVSIHTLVIPPSEDSHRAGVNSVSTFLACFGINCMMHRPTRLAKFAQYINESEVFKSIVTGSIMLSVLSQCTLHFNQPEWLGRIQDICDIACFCVYAAEVVVKLWALGLIPYFRAIVNLGDFVIVIISFIALISSSISVGFLRMLRVLRMMRVFRRLGSLLIILECAVSGVRAMVNAFFFFALSIFVFALVGFTLFNDDNGPRLSFPDYWGTVRSLFVCLTKDGWEQLMYYNGVKRGFIAYVFFYCYQVYCDWLILNLFITLVIENFQDTKDILSDHLTKQNTLARILLLFRRCLPPSLVEALESPQTNVTFQGNGSQFKYMLSEDIVVDKNASLLNRVVRRTLARRKLLTTYASQTQVSLLYESALLQYPDVTSEVGQQSSPRASRGGSKAYSDSSLFLFSMDNPIRQWCLRIVSHKYYNLFYLIVIFISSIFLAWDPAAEANLENPPTAPKWTRPFEYFFITVFGMDIVMKIIAKGLLLSPDAFCSEGWNLFDVLILAANIVSLKETRAKPLRLLRVFRVFRIITRISTLRVVVRALLITTGSIINIFFLMLFLTVIYALGGVAFFNGQFYSCTDEDRRVDRKLDCVKTFVDASVLVPRAWLAYSSTFDSIFSGLKSVSEIITLDNWSLMMFKSMDFRGVNLNPRKDSSPINQFYFMGIVICLSLFMANMFTGVLLNGVASYGGERILTKAQRSWVEFKHQLPLIKVSMIPRPPAGGVRQYFYKVAMMGEFNQFINVVLVIHCIVSLLALVVTRKKDLVFIDIIIWIFLGIYLLESLIKMIAFGIVMYFRDAWNIFDLLTTVAAIVSSLLSLFPTTRAASIVSYSRLLRTIRIVRLVRTGKRAQAMFNAIIITLPSIFNITLLFFVLIMTFGFMGKIGMGNIKYQESYSTHRNFRKFSTSTFLLYAIMTRDGWVALLRDCRLFPPLCTQTATFDDCGNNFVLAFYFSFVTIGSYLFLNLMVSVIIENYGRSLKSGLGIVSDEDLEMYRTVWNFYDGNVNGKVPMYRMSYIIQRLYNSGVTWSYMPYQHRLKFKVLREQFVRQGFKKNIYFLNFLRTCIVNQLSFEFLVTAEVNELTSVVTRAVYDVMAARIQSAWIMYKVILDLRREAYFEDLTGDKYQLIKKIRGQLRTLSKAALFFWLNKHRDGWVIEDLDLYTQSALHMYRTLHSLEDRAPAEAFGKRVLKTAVRPQNQVLVSAT